MLRIIPRPRYKLYLNTKIMMLIIRKIITGKVYRGKCVKEFEEKFRKYINTKYALCTPMARTALYLLLISLNLKKNDEVIVTPYTVADVINMVILADLKPVFVDIDYTYNMDPKKIESKITKRTKVVLLTHLFGQPCDIDKINAIAKKHNLITIEDCAQACGAEYRKKKVGGLCDFGYFSFSSYKNVTTFYGGIITTNNKGMIEKIKRKVEKYPYPPVFMLSKRILRDILLFVMTSKLVFPVTYVLISVVNLFDDTFIDRFLSTKIVLRKKMPPEYEIKYTNLQAAIGLEQLKRVDKGNQRRIQNAMYYNENLKDLKQIKIPKNIDNVKNTYLNYPVLYKNRKVLLKKLFKAGIDSTVGNLPNCAELEVFKDYKSSCPVCSKVVKEVFYLPIQPQVKKSQLKYIVNCIKKFLK